MRVSLQEVLESKPKSKYAGDQSHFFLLIEDHFGDKIDSINKYKNEKCDIYGENIDEFNNLAEEILFKISNNQVK